MHKHQLMSPAQMTKELLISKCDYFIDVQVWPKKTVLDSDSWLENFNNTEMEHAVHLLNSFLYISDELINSMFIASFHSLSNRIRATNASYLTAKASWQSFVDTIIITPITGEEPNPSDSGNLFARKARKWLNIKEEQVMDQIKCLQTLVNGSTNPVVFVDDFVGSGEQFLATWRRKVELNPSGSISFSDISSARRSRFFYCPIICTEPGYLRLQQECPEIILSPAHILSKKYSAIENDSVIWPDHLKQSAYDFLFNASVRAGIKDTHGGVDDWRGFNKLGLAIALGDSVPDATLPIFYWEKNGWKPLIRRT